MRLSRVVSRRVWRLIQYACLAALLILAVPTLLGYNRSRGGGAIDSSDSSKDQRQREEDPEDSKVKLDPSLTPDDPRYWDQFKNNAAAPLKDWHDYKAMEVDQSRKGPGEQGAPVALPSDPETKKLAEAVYRVNGFSGLVSDQIALNRSIKDIRHKGCRELRYGRLLPSVTVIFPFHNEHWSTLLRSVHSVIDRSPRSVLKQIVLVDDFSSKEFLKKQLDEYVAKTFARGFVLVVRTAKREGLIRARQIGATHATGDVMVFLDSHSEAGYNWLPPLVDPIAQDYRTVVCPFVDVIDCDTFEYRAQDEGARGSFDWEFSYKRLPLLPEDRENMPKPFRSPVMAGGYFAISRKFFWDLGGYDEGLDIWGGEQYELSFKVWQCHGRMFDAPCSRVGHIYRCKFVPFPNPGVGDFISRNYKRVAVVWMDDYKEHLFERRPGMKTASTGDLTKQLAVRERLQCKSFSWFMTEVMFDQDRFYPAVEPPDGANGELRNLAGSATKCVDTQFKGKDDRFELRTCVKEDPNAGGEQNMRFSFWRDLRPAKRSVCFDVSTSTHHAPVVLFPCHGMQGNQAWKYLFDSDQLFHPVSGLCLDCDPERGEIFMSKCDKFAKSQQWRFERINRTVIESWKYEN